MELNERVAALEERTRERPKTILDQVKEWGGVATLVVALLYTFPLGVWDRFYLTTKAREAAEVADLRKVALEVARLDGDWARSAGSIPTPDLRTMATRAVGSQKVTLLTGKLEALERHKDQLTAPELVMFAYSVSQMNMPELTETIYATAFEKSEESGNVGLAADILRLRASALLGDVNGLDLEKMRELYSQSAELLAPLETDAFKLQYAFNVFEWSQIELTKGDWACGERLASIAGSTLASLPPLNPTILQYQQHFRMSMSQVSRGAGQPIDGCPEEHTEHIQ